MPPTKKKRHAVRWIAGIRFIASGDGHYRSDDGKYGLFHMLRDMPERCWELFTLDSKGRPDHYIDGHTWLSGLKASVGKHGIQHE